MVIHNKTQTLEYNKDKGTINLCTYSDDGFLESELDITDKVTTLVLDKLYDDYNLDDGDELLITKASNKKKKSKITL
ncbi:hypothetical protein [Arcobacter caeni]|uniref:Uncharacterized protein n=1 Tax=Arcobacter caeni TaxID=1912877 RepID=A0A363D2H2_9BACT|nr:hypothetical protein [Arcobacter caeni]PUE65482.1 hypothetical protein B0174_03945 [Arcobacter caeni]